MKLGNDKDKFGFYQVGDFKTYSKVEGIELHRRTGIHPHWNFNELEYSSYNWAVEPSESLEQLYAKRARQLRDNYDYIVLFFSGGADSTNILDTFVDNNIPFDEVATYNYLSADADPDSYLNGEQIRVSYPKIKQLHAQGVKFIHRPIDLSDMTQTVLTDPKYKLERAYYGAAHWGTSHLTKSYIRDMVPEYRKLIDSGKRVVFVWGCDKPRLYKENNRYCIKFIDQIDAGISMRTQLINRDDEYDELFYWAPECTDIVCKQGHILKRFFERHKELKTDSAFSDQLVDFPELDQIFESKLTEDGLTYRNMLNMLVYPKFSPKTFSWGKPYCLITSQRERVFNKDTHYKAHLDLLKQHLSQLDAYWLNDPTEIEKGLKLCISPAYYLE